MAVCFNVRQFRVIEDDLKLFCDVLSLYISLPLLMLSVCNMLAIDSPIKQKLPLIYTHIAMQITTMVDCLQKRHKSSHDSVIRLALDGRQA